jgi:dCMP deaminase
MREGRIDWDDYNMLLAVTASLRSPDPNTQVGAYICTRDNKPLSLGYNGTPRGIDPASIPWAREHADPLQTKYPWIAHAEKNAILNAATLVRGAKLYVTLHPCNSCAIDLIQAGISEVAYLHNPYRDQWQTIASVKMLEAAGVKVYQHIWHVNIDKNMKELLAKL